MPQPPQAVDTLFEDLWEDRPPATVEMARELKACTRARQLNPPVPLLRRVWLYGGRDKSVRAPRGLRRGAG